MRRERLRLARAAQGARQLTPAQREKQAKRLRQAKRVLLLSTLLTVLFSVLLAVSAKASGFTINVGPTDEAGGMGAMEVIAIMAFLALIPSIFMMMTSFTRIIIVLGFMRTAIGTAQSPPNMVLTSLTLFLTLFIMMPVLTEMNQVAFQPYLNEEITAVEAVEAAGVPIKRFMLKQVDAGTLELFLDLSKTEAPAVLDMSDPVELLDLPILVITPAFILSEISRAFMMGFLIYLPFLVIDLVVSSILMSMGMMMLPPGTIALPFKILMFVLVDGWSLMMDTLVTSYRW